MAEEKPSNSGELISSEVQDEIVSMVDVLEEEKRYEDDANAVLGGSDPTKCTYNQGYIKRQALYSCMTCIKPERDPAGICLACSLECHDGHDLIELYTKRNFKCDCGNSKFPERKCKLIAEKDSVNENNSYNQNFGGIYCTCHRPYPDDEDEVEDEMIQCVVCEDWLHGRHTGTEKVPEDYEEFICEQCCKKSPFLYLYTTLVTKLEPTKETSEINVEDAKPSCDEANEENAANNLAQSEETSSCVLEKLEKTKPTSLQTSGGVFMFENWRANLCQCNKCKDMYSELEIVFLSDQSDTVSDYEKDGKAKGRLNQYENGLQALQSIDRTQQVEVLTEYTSMKDKLAEYLKKFADNKKVVREEDIKEFFEGLKANKRARTNVQQFCR